MAIRQYGKKMDAVHVPYVLYHILYCITVSAIIIIIKYYKNIYGRSTMALSMLSSLVKPRVGAVVGGSILRIGSSMKKKQPVLSILSASSSSSLSSSSSSFSSSYDQDSSSSLFPRNTYGLAALGMLIIGNSISDDNNDQTTYMAPSSDESTVSFISSELITAAAKIFRNSSPQQCTLPEALEYAGIPRDYANTEACISRLRKQIGIINAYHDAPRFGSSKDEFKERYKAIFDSIPLSVSIENKHGRLLKMLGLPELPPGSILVGGKKEFLPSIYIINSKSGKKTASAIGQHLGRKAKAWTTKRIDDAAAAATSSASAVDAAAAAAGGISRNNNIATTTPSEHLITERQEVVSPMTVDTSVQGSFARMTLSSSSSALAPVSLLTSASAAAASAQGSFARMTLSSSSSSSSSALAPVSLLTSASAAAASAAVSTSIEPNLFEPSPFLEDLVTKYFDADDDNDLASLEHGSLIEPTTKRHGQNSKSSQLITSLSSNEIKRNTLLQEQAERQEEERQKSNKILMHKIGSLLWQGFTEGETDLTRFDTADKCAGLMNRLFGYRGVSGYQLSNAVKEKRAGKPPPEQGRPTILSSTVFDLLCRFFFSYDSVNQANGNDHNDRTKNISLLGRIVNEHRKRKGEKEVDCVHLYKRILHANSLKQEQTVPDTRESYRHLWLTFRNQNLNHEKWEEATVRLGIARPPVNDEEKEKEGNVVFEIDGEDTRKNVIFFDETAIFLDASESSAGRNPSKTSNPLLPNVGKAGSKSSDKFTLLTIVNGNCELLPFLTIVPSKAKEGNRKINPGMLMGYQQLQGKYGCLAPQTHSCTFASTEKGGMSNEVFHNWVTEHIPMYYPDTCEEAGRRIIGKVDGGTGRNHIESLAGMKLNSMHLFAGTPNCTEANQEIDQLFGAFKAVVYSNRDKLFTILVKIDGGKARLTVNDMGYIIFGGKREFGENRFNITHIDLANATDKLSRDHIRSACEKVGYCPATREACNHHLVRHQQVFKEDEDGNLTADEEADPMAYILEEIEQELHDTIDVLVEEGMTEAEDARVYVDKVVLKTNDEGKIVHTKPNTREHQDMLQNYRTQGDFFRLTNGGDVATSSDMILAMERKRNIKVIKELEKEKDAKINYHEKIVPNAKKVFKKKFPWKHGVDYKAAILYSQGPNPKEKVKMGQHSDVLKEIYMTRFFGKSRGLSREELYHTRAAETKLELRKSGELVDYTETAIWNDTINTQTNFLESKMRTIPFNQQLKVHRRMSSPHHDFPLSANQKRKVANVWLGIQELQLNDADNNDGDSVISEESLTELLSDNDDDDRVGVGNVGDAPNKKNATATAKKKKKKATATATAAASSHDSDDNLNSDDDDSFREEESISSKESLNLYDGATDEEEDGARTTRRKRNTKSNANTRPTRICTRTPIIDGEDDEKEDDQSQSDGSNDTGRNTRTGRNRTRRGVAEVEMTTASMIADLKEMKEESDKQAAFEKELSSMWLKKAKKELEEGGTLTIPFLKALIKSKGVDPPDGRRRAPFETAWNKVKDDADWKRKVFFGAQDEKNLQLFEEDNSEDEE